MVNADFSFANMVKGLEVNEMAWLMDELVHSLPNRRYVILFTPRSGSSWLTNVLAETKQLGNPEEYLNPNFVRGVASAVNSTIPEEFLAGLQRRRQTQNGVFGIEAREMDIEFFGADCFFNIFDESTIFFNLWRENIVAQAVSLFRAVETQQFHIKQGDTAAAPPAYNTKNIGKWMIQLAMQENANLKLLQQRARPFINLRYEDIVSNRKQTLRRFAAALGLELAPEILLAQAERPLMKIANDWNHETEMQFRNEAAALVARIEANRKIRSYVADSSCGEAIAHEPASMSVVTPLRMVRAGS